MKVGSLFSGIGGIELGLHAALNCEPAWFCERAPFPRRVLQSLYPEIPVYGDVSTLAVDTPVASVDILTGGFPCQDLSVAGKNLGLAGARSGLWFEMLRLIEVGRPAWVVIENVSVLTTRGLDVVLAGLHKANYSAEWQVIPALAVGALHQRARLFIVAYLGKPKVIFDSSALVEAAFRRNRLSFWSREPCARTLARGAVLSTTRKERLQVLGNAVVPQCAEVVGQYIAAASSRAPIRDVPGLRWSSLGDKRMGQTPVPSTGAMVDGVIYVTAPIAPLGRARARHVAMPGPLQHLLSTSTGLLPTPMARDWKDVGPTQGGRKSPGLGVIAARLALPARLQHMNPAWVEWLMGFPAGWVESADANLPEVQDW